MKNENCQFLPMRFHEVAADKYCAVAWMPLFYEYNGSAAVVNLITNQRFYLQMYVSSPLLAANLIW